MSVPAVTGMEIPKNLQDCYFFYYSTCRNGKSCPYRWVNGCWKEKFIEFLILDTSRLRWATRRHASCGWRASASTANAPWDIWRYRWAFLIVEFVTLVENFRNLGRKRNAIGKLNRAAAWSLTVSFNIVFQDVSAMPVGLAPTRDSSSSPSDLKADSFSYHACCKAFLHHFRAFLHFVIVFIIYFSVFIPPNFTVIIFII